jgi:hypothetical protein
VDNTALLLAQLQFGLTLTYHFWFVALTLGQSILIAFMETLYLRTDDQVYYIFRQKIDPDDAALDNVLDKMNWELKTLIGYAYCLADVMSCVIRALSGDDPKVTERLRPRHKVMLLGEDKRDAEPEK